MIWKWLDIRLLMIDRLHILVLIDILFIFFIFYNWRQVIWNIWNILNILFLWYGRPNLIRYFRYNIAFILLISSAFIFAFFLLIIGIMYHAAYNWTGVAYLILQNLLYGWSSMLKLLPIKFTCLPGDPIVWRGNPINSWLAFAPSFPFI